MDKPLQQTIWITGASSGIGKALALLLAAEGHRIYISARSGEKLQQMAADHRGDLVPLPCDVTDDAVMHDLFPSLDAPPEHLDCIILSAGLCEYIEMPDLDVASMRRVFDSNLFGVANACAAALPLLSAAKQRPLIVGISSMSCYRGFPRAEAYGSSKAAMSYFLESLRSDIQQDIDVSIVYPGFVDTPMAAQNDFFMPAMTTVDYAAGYIRKKMRTRPRTVRFPRRMHWLLKLSGLSQAFWFRVITPRISRAGKNR